MSQRDDLLCYAREELNTEAEYLWARDPEAAVLRHEANQKWYGLIMQIPAHKLGIPMDEPVDILTVKLEPLLIDGLRGLPGFYPAWHMNKKSWMTILLDGTVELEQVKNLLNSSFDLTSPKKKKGVLANCHDWLIPANPKYFDVEAAFEQNDILRWKQTTHVSVGDTIYMYMGAPVSGLRFRCKAVEVDLPYVSARTGKEGMSMMIQLQETYPLDYMPRKVLYEEYGIYSVRGPRSVPPSLLAELRAHAGEAEDV